MVCKCEYVFYCSFLRRNTIGWECDASDGQYRDLTSAKTLRVPLMKVIKRGTKHINARKVSHLMAGLNSLEFPSYQISIHSISVQCSASIALNEHS